MLPLFPPPLPEDEAIPVTKIILDPPTVDPVPILTIEGFRGVTAEQCREVLDVVGGSDAHFQEMRMELEAALSVREYYEDYSFHPTLTAITHELAAHMCAFGALPIPPERFPRVRVGFPEEFHRLFGTQELLTHARSYHFAQKVAIDRITNWHAFFALPEEDVRRRFFCKDQDYRNI